MRAHKGKIAIVVWGLLVGCGGYAWGGVAATVNPDYAGFSALITNIGDSGVTEGRVYGWRFFVDKPITITHLGLFAMHRDGAGNLVDGSLSTTHTMALWRLPKEGGLFDLRCVVTVGPEAAIEGHFAYAPLADPLTIVPDLVPSPTGNYEKWLLGVWTGPSNADLLYQGPLGAVTLDAVQAGVMRLQAYTYYYKFINLEEIYTSSELTPPWGTTATSNRYFALNFKYELVGPKAEAGADVSIYTSEQAVTTINGLATHATPDTPMQYRWLEGGNVLQDWAVVGAGGAANLSLAAPVSAFSIGNYTLTLEVKDAKDTVSDEMILTVSNSPPDGQPTPTYQVLEIGVDAILIGASVADFDGDTVSYTWMKDDDVIGWGTANPPAGGMPVKILDLTIPAGDPRFRLGTNVVQLVINDGVNPEETQEAAVMVQDTVAPTVAPTPSIEMLWPPNRTLIPVTIWANAVHNIGGSILLSASVVSSEPDDGSPDQDWFVDAIDGETGTISLRLRAERAGSGGGRVYTITTTGTDTTGNASSATVDIRVPHARRKM